jgi:aldehyde dehydrogenase (NAD+)
MHLDQIETARKISGTPPANTSLTSPSAEPRPRPPIDQSLKDNSDMLTLVESQRAYFNSNATKSVAFRVKQLKRLHAILKTNESAICEAIYSDYSKSEFDSFLTEFLVLYDDLQTAIRSVSRWAKTQPARTNLLNWPASSYIIPEPLGVTLVIGAWNYPIQLSLTPVVAAMAAGNTIILKPSELCTASSRITAKLINENFAPDYFKVVEGGIPETTALLEQKFDKIFFTGSTTVGRIVYQAAAKNLTPVTLELGGKSPVIVTPDCDLNISVKRVVWAKFLNAGQTCIAPDYVLVHESVEKAFIEKVKQEIKASNLSIANRNYVQIINERNTARIIGLIEQAKVVMGGDHSLPDRYIAPTLMTGVEFTDRIMSEEIFGPVLPVLRYTDLDAAIAQIKARPKPLSLYLFTNDRAIREKVLREVSFGGGCVNDAIMHISNGHLPFGGVGASGMGRYHGEAGFHGFSHYKSVLDKPVWFEPRVKYFPHTSLKLRLLRWLGA